MPQNTPTNIEKVFELLDKRLVTWGVPGAISIVGIDKVRASLWGEAAWCFVAAAGVWVAIKVGKKLAPKFDQMLDWSINEAERLILEKISTLRADFTGKYLRQLAQLNEEFTTEGFNPDRTAIPMLEDVFVPLDLSGMISNSNVSRKVKAMSLDNLDIWKLLRRARRERIFRQMIILAQGGMGKTTLLCHITLIYSQHKQRRFRAPKLVPVLLRLRNWHNELAQEKMLSLPQLITEYYIPSLSKNHPLTPPSQWAKMLLERGSALVMLDGFDEIPEAKRPRVSHWISTQMREYTQSIFILTSRPAGYKDYIARKPAIPLFVKKFNQQQQQDFIRRWYFCQEKCFRSERQIRHAKFVAQERSDNLIAQLEKRQGELNYMAENPLLLNMLVTFHRFDPAAELPRQRLDLYRGISKLQLEDRPKARLIRMLLPSEKSNALLRKIAFGMVKANCLTVQQQPLIKFLAQQPLLKHEEVAAIDWLEQIVGVSELLVEREPGEYEFPHASFQGFFAATLLAYSQDRQTFRQNMLMVLQNWNEAIWQETVLLYTAQLTPKLLDRILRKACKQGSEAAELAIICLKEYPRPEKLHNDPKALLENLKFITIRSKYQKLEKLLQTKQWRKADAETYRLMITTVGKEEGQWFDLENLSHFPCEDLEFIDRLWVMHSDGKFGFSIQRHIYRRLEASFNGNHSDKSWGRFCSCVGWYHQGLDLDAMQRKRYEELIANPTESPLGELPTLRIAFESDYKVEPTTPDQTKSPNPKVQNTNFDQSTDFNPDLAESFNFVSDDITDPFSDENLLGLINEDDFDYIDSFEEFGSLGSLPEFIEDSSEGSNNWGRPWPDVGSEFHYLSQRLDQCSFSQE